ncbi:MAG TPA: hypothetical protein PKH40_11155 [Treponemataceae bacterium]|jgi:hypothetical protein|nr:hypothetical protein [Treponemataceae bacterium]HPX47539.1 hypothetical protein [Treponemataceae bacterium]
MNVAVKNSLIKYGFLVLFFVCLAILLGLAHYLSGTGADNRLKTGIETMLTETYSTAIILEEKITVHNAGWTFLEAWKSGKETVLALRVTGTSGPYTGVFVYDGVGSTNFAGILGSDNSDASTRGLSRYTITVWENRITSLVQNGADSQ